MCIRDSYNITADGTLAQQVDTLMRELDLTDETVRRDAGTTVVTGVPLPSSVAQADDLKAAEAAPVRKTFFLPQKQKQCDGETIKVATRGGETITVEYNQTSTLRNVKAQVVAEMKNRELGLSSDTSSGHALQKIDKYQQWWSKLKKEDLRTTLLLQRERLEVCLLYTSPSPRDLSTSRMPSSA